MPEDADQFLPRERLHERSVGDDGSVTRMGVTVQDTLIQDSESIHGGLNYLILISPLLAGEPFAGQYRVCE